MRQTSTSLLDRRRRTHLMRGDTAQILKRFFLCGRSLLISEAAWLPLISSIDIKTELTRFVWQDAQTADAMRERVFELRYPNRLMEEEGTDRPLIALFNAIRNAPSVPAFLSSLGTVLLPALLDSYRAYLEASDPIADGPTYRFLSLALSEKEEQVRTVNQWTEAMLSENPGSRTVASAWTTAIAARLADSGGVSPGSSILEVESEPLPGSRTYSVPDRPARDSRFWPCRFYWPDIVDSSFPYGEGTSLQLRSAISHLNEIWAVEDGGIMLSSFADVLPWEWIKDAARWTYDEARHCSMGYDRLLAWGFNPAEIPLGTYIYDCAAGEDPIYRLGLLFFFETKNIGHKLMRARLFHNYGDRVSEHDMDFDWADETIHASYGKYWLEQLLIARGQDPSTYDAIRQRSQEMITACVSTASPEEIRALKKKASALIAKASREL